MKKASVLILTFLIPVLIAVFLKFFSVNHFELRVLYQDDVPVVPGCPQVDAPYVIDDQMRFIDADSADVFPFAGTSLKVVGVIDEESLVTEVNMISDAFFDVPEATVFVFTEGMDISDWKVPLADNATLVSYPDGNLNDLKRCVFLLDAAGGDNALLVDEVNRIRGYYNLKIGQEVDSLIIETKILLREMQLEDQ